MNSSVYLEERGVLGRLYPELDEYPLASQHEPVRFGILLLQGIHGGIELGACAPPSCPCVPFIATGDLHETS